MAFKIHRNSYELAIFMFGDFGYRETKKERKRRILEENCQRGKRGELLVRVSYGRFGDKVKKLNAGADFEIESKALFTGKVTKKRIEVKTNDAELSPLQRKMLKRRKVKVERVYTPF